MTDQNLSTEIVVYNQNVNKDDSDDRIQKALEELQKNEELVNEENIPIKLNSQWDVLLEILLTHSYKVEAYGKYEGDGECCICLEPLHNTYVFQYPCVAKDVMHRNCALTHILTELKKNALFTNAEKCPVCNTLILKLK